MKLISVLTPCYNEEENVEALYEAVRSVFATRPQYRYEHLFIDNASKDRTAEILRAIAARDKNVKVILNTRNFGQVRSPYHALLQTSGDAVVAMAADFQDPPEMISQFLEKWEQGHKVVMAVKEASREHRIMYALRKWYYGLLARIANVEIVQNATGFGLYDRVVVDALRRMEDPYPFFRGGCA